MTGEIDIITDNLEEKAIREILIPELICIKEMIGNNEKHEDRC